MSEVRTPSASVTIRGKKFIAVEVTLQGSVNSVPTASVRGHFAEDATATMSSAEIPLAKIIALAADYQNYLLNTERLTPDVIIHMTDGAGGKSTFEGFLSAPSFGAVAGSISVSFQAVHRVSILSAFDGSIYAHSALQNERVLLKMALTKTGFAGLLLEVLTGAIKKFKETKGYLTGNAVRDITLPLIHARNQKVLPYVKSILELSDESTMYPEAAKAIKQVDQQALKLTLLQCFTSGDNLLSGLLGGFNSAFPCLFAAGFIAGVPAAGFSLVDAVNVAGTDVDLPADGLTFSAGGSYSLPIRGVFITTDLAYKTGTEAGGAINHLEKICAYYPPNTNMAAGGNFVRIGAPSWIPDPVPLGLKLEVLNNLKAADKPDIATIKESEIKLANLFAKSVNVVQILLDRYARSQFNYMALANTQASINTPLSLGLHIGRVYNVTAGGTKMLTGFLQSVTHSIAINNNTAQATTSATFSHVRTAGVNIPGGQASGLGFNPAGGNLGFNPAGGNLGFNPAGGALGGSSL